MARLSCAAELSGCGAAELGGCDAAELGGCGAAELGGCGGSSLRLSLPLSAGFLLQHVCFAAAVKCFDRDVC